MVSVSVFNISKASRRYMPFTEPQAIALETCDKRKMIVEADVLLPVRLAPETPHKLATAFQQSTEQDGFECVESFLSASQSSFGSPASVSCKSTDFEDVEPARQISSIEEARDFFEDVAEEIQDLQLSLEDSKKFAKEEPFLRSLGKLAEHKRKRLLEDLEQLVYSGDDHPTFDDTMDRLVQSLNNICTDPILNKFTVAAP